MKVKELIKKLQQYNPDCDLWFKCYDSDYKHSMCHTNKPKFIFYKDIDEIEIDLTDYFRFDEYNTEKYNNLKYIWSDFNNESERTY